MPELFAKGGLLLFLVFRELLYFFSERVLLFFELAPAGEERCQTAVCVDVRLSHEEDARELLVALHIFRGKCAIEVKNLDAFLFCAIRPGKSLFFGNRMCERGLTAAVLTVDEIQRGRREVCVYKDRRRERDGSDERSAFLWHGWLHRDSFFRGNRFSYSIAFLKAGGISSD